MLPVHSLVHGKPVEQSAGRVRQVISQRNTWRGANAAGLNGES